MKATHAKEVYLCDFPESFISEFWNQFDHDWAIQNKSRCWTWLGRIHPNGYGYFRSSISAHRFSFLMRHGGIPPKYLVCHKCDNPKCINPLHLFLGTHKDNARDMFDKGRANTARGERASHAKLTTKQVKEIRDTFDPLRKYESYCNLAQKFGVAGSTIWNIVRRVTWKHVP